jgi:hypothetical protein
MFVFNLQLTILNDKKRSLNSSCIRVEPDLFILNVPYDRDFFRDFELSTELLNASDEISWIVVGADPVAIHENFVVASCTNHGLGMLA